MRAVLFAIASLFSITSNACCGVIAATISYEPLDGSTYRITVEVFTCLSAPSDHPEIVVDFGADVDTVPRFELIDDVSRDLRRSIYRSDHTFPGSGTHEIHATIGNRAGGIVNIPFSISQTLCVEALIHIDPELGPNNSIRFNNPPTEVVQNWNAFSYQPDPADEDGDSLVFEMGPARGLVCQPILGYEFLTGINVAWVDPTDGNFIWDYPPFNGAFSLVLQGSEYRNGQLIGRVTRDMTICVAGFIAGVDDIGPTRQLVLSPSITADVIQIENPFASPLPISIHDARGSLVGSRTLTVGRSSIDLSELPAGAYSISAISATGLGFRGRVLKQ